MVMLVFVLKVYFMILVVGNIKIVKCQSHFENVNLIDNKEERLINDQIVQIMKLYHPHLQRHGVFIYGDAPTDDLYPSLLKLNAFFVIKNMAFAEFNTFSTDTFDETLNFYYQQVGFYIIFIDTDDQLPNALFQLNNNKFSSREVRVIIYCKKLQDKALLFYSFWWYKTLLCVLLTYDDKTEKIVLNEYSPFVTEIDTQNTFQYNCGCTVIENSVYYTASVENILKCTKSCSEFGYNDTHKLLPTCIEIKAVSLWNIFEDQTKDFKGSSLNVFAVNMPPYEMVYPEKEGLDRFGGRGGTLLKVLASKMNFTVQYSPSAEIMNPTFKTFYFALLNMSNRIFDISMNCYYVLPFNYLPIELTYPTQESGICFAVHRSGTEPTWVNILKIFNLSTLILTIILFFSMVFMFYLHTKFYQNQAHKEALVLGCLHTIALFLSHPVYLIKKPLKILSHVVFWVFWVTFVLNFMFQGAIVSFLTVPQYKTNPNSLKDLHATGLPIESMPFYADFLPDTNDVYKDLNKRTIWTQKLVGCTNDLVEADGKACYVDCGLAEAVVKTNKDEYGKSFVHLGKERINNFYLAYPLTRHSPWKRRVDHYLGLIVQSGLINHWTKVGQSIKEETANFKVLKLTDLQGGFFLLLGGLLLATIVFILEHISKFQCFIKTDAKKKFKNAIIKVRKVLYIDSFKSKKHDVPQTENYEFNL